MASWKRSLCDGGLHDCLRAYLIPCCVFGQTRYRLERIECHENPLDLEGYRSSNGPCWDWFFFALPLGISCAVFTSNEIRRVRDLYRIAGSRKKDIATAVCCPCCAVLRNELEVRTREEEKWTELHGPDDKGYTPEKQMTSSLPEGVYSGKENVAPGIGSKTSTYEASVRSVNGSRRSSATSGHKAAATQTNAPNTPKDQSTTSTHSGRSSPSHSLTGSRNTETVTCTVVDDGQRHVLHLNRSLLTPVPERLSEDTISTARKSKVCISPPLQSENKPLGSIQESSLTDSPGENLEPVSSSPLVSRPSSPRKSLDRPPTPIPREGVMSPVLSVRSGHSGRSFRKIPLLPASDTVPSPVQELVEDAQDPIGHASTPGVKVSPVQRPGVAAESAVRTPELSTDNLDKQSTIPQIAVEGWLDDVGSPSRRDSTDILPHAFPHMPVLMEKTPNESTVTNLSLTPPALTPLPVEVTDRKPEATHWHGTSNPAIQNVGEAIQAFQPATALSALSTTITDAIKSLMPVPGPSTTGWPEHNVPIQRHPATAAAPEPAGRNSAYTGIPARAETVDDVEVENSRQSTDLDKTPANTEHAQEPPSPANQHTSSCPVPGALPAHTSTSDQNQQASSSNSYSKIPHPNPVTPKIPPRPQRREPTGFPFTTTTTTPPHVAVPIPATPAPPGTYPVTPAAPPPPPPEPVTPTPPGFYPSTPAAASSSAPKGALGEGHPFGFGAVTGREGGTGEGQGQEADRGPFVSFRARQLLGHFLGRNPPKRGTDRGSGGGKGGGVRGNSLHEDERVWGSGTVSRARARGDGEDGGRRTGRGWRGRGRGRRGMHGTE